MSTKKSFFKPIDNFVFGQIEQLRKSNIYQQIEDQFAALHHNQQQILNQILTFIYLLAPITVVIYLFSVNWGLRQELQTKQQVLEYAQKIITQNNDLTQKSRILYTRQKITNQNELQANISAIAESIGINLSNLTVQGFTSTKLSEYLEKAQATLNFNNLSNQDIINLLGRLAHQEKFKISHLELNKSGETLTGQVGLAFFFKPITQQ